MAGRRTEEGAGWEHSPVGSNGLGKARQQVGIGENCVKGTSRLAYAARLRTDLGKELCVSITNDKGALNGSPERRRKQMRLVYYVLLAHGGLLSALLNRLMVSVAWLSYAPGDCLPILRCFALRCWLGWEM